MSLINELVLEVRYKPNPKILDYRGSLAEAVSKHMELPEWRILENRIDIFAKEGDHAFVGFRNSGFVAHDVPTKNYFPDKTTKFFRCLFSLDGFEKKPNIQRIGVLSKFCVPFEGAFDDLLNKYTSNYLSLTENAKKTMSAKLTDIGGHLNFSDKYGNFSTMSGPMLEKQMPDFFEKEREFPKVGLYYQIDYWIAPKNEMDDKEVLFVIHNFATSGWSRFEDMRKVVLG